MVDDELLTKAAQCITGGDFLGAMDIFQTIMDNHSDSPVGFHGWAEAAMFEIQENGNIDDSGNDRFNEGQIQSFLKKATKMEPENPEYLAAFANALIEFDRVPMAIREFQRLHELGQASEENDVSFHLYEAARLLIDSIDVKTNFDRSHDFARKYVRTAIEFSLLGLGFSSAEEAMEYMTSDE